MDVYVCLFMIIYGLRRINQFVQIYTNIPRKRSEYIYIIYIYIYNNKYFHVTYIYIYIGNMNILVVI